MNSDLKSDNNLGIAVNQHLTRLGINTPMTSKVSEDNDRKIEQIATLIGDVLDTLGLDLKDDSLEETPMRVAKMFVNEIFAGLRTDTFPKCTTVDNKFASENEFVCEKNITLYSDCEHHLRPIIGVAHVAYIPKDKVLGLSKLNRIVQYFASRPQVQERLTHQIAEAISFVIGSDDVVVMIDASHTCVSQRGIKDTNSSTATMAAKGVFAERNSQLRQEFLANVKGG